MSTQESSSEDGRMRSSFRPDDRSESVSMNVSLTDLQRDVIQRMNTMGLEPLAERAAAAWRNGRELSDELSPAEEATMQGAMLLLDFVRANEQARRRGE